MSDNLPTASIVEPASATTKTVTDSKGRVLVVKKHNALDKFRLMKAIGQDSSNQMMMAFTLIAASVSEIDGVPQPTPYNYGMVEAMIQRLGDEGIEAAAGAFADADPSAMLATAKN